MMRRRTALTAGAAVGLIVLVVVGLVPRSPDPDVPPTSPAAQFGVTGWRGIQYFESRTYVGARRTLVSRQEGLLDPARRQAIVRTYNSAGSLVSEAAALDRVVVARSPGDEDWSVARRSEYRQLLAAARANVPEIPEPVTRPLDPATSPAGWRLQRPDRALQATLPGEHATVLADALREPVRAALGATLPAPSGHRDISWRRWWRSGHLIAEERRLTVVRSPDASDDAVEMVHSVMYTEPRDPHLDLVHNARLLGWDDVGDAAHRANTELRRYDASPANTFSYATSSGTCRNRLASYTLTQQPVPQPQPAQPTGPRLRVVPGGLPAVTVAQGIAEESGVRRIPAPPPPPPADELERLPRPGQDPRPGPRTSGSTGPRAALPPGAWLPGLVDQLGEMYYIATLYDSWARFAQAVNAKIREATDALQRLQIPDAPTPQPAPKARSKRGPVTDDGFYESYAEARVKDPPVNHPDPCLEPWEKDDIVDEWDPQDHHIASDKSEDNPRSGRKIPWSVRFDQLLRKHFGEDAPDLDDDWNIMTVRHRASDCSGGGHAEEYHEWVYENMETLAEEADGDVEWFKEQWQRMKKEIHRDPTIMTCEYWDCITP